MVNDDSRTIETAVRQRPNGRTTSSGELALMSAAGEVHVLSETTTLIGRTSDAQIRTIDPQVSRRHAEITRGSDGRMRVTDLGSRHGTFVNRQRVSALSPIEIAAGDTLVLGDTCSFLVVATSDARRISRGDYSAITVDVRTGLFVWRYFFEALTREVSACARHGLPLAIAAFEFEADESAFVSMAGVVRGASRVEDLVSREPAANRLVVMLRECDEEYGARFVSRVRHALTRDSPTSDAVAMKTGVTGLEGSGARSAQELLDRLYASLR